MNYSILSFFFFLFLLSVLISLTAVVSGIAIFALSWLINATTDNVLDFLTIIRYKDNALNLPERPDPIGQFEL